jgi:chemotaxis protein histidine kinase CheA
MKTDIRKMIAEAYELEGLLLLADNRGADTPEYVFTAIGEKLDRLQMLLGEREGDDGEETQEDACMVENDVADAVSEEPEPEPEEDVAEVTAEQVADGEYDNEQEPMVELVLDDEPTAEPTAEPDAETPNVADETEDVEAEDNIEEETEANEKASDDSEPLRLDEKLQRSRSKDLKSAFSLNDTFRFRRELFGNSAAEMTDALHMVEAMHSFDEAEDYFYGDLGWDRESDDVKEFMAIIKNHFL